MKTLVFSLFLAVIPSLFQSAQQSEKRLALLIGNADYGDPDYNLANPGNDVASMKSTLSDLGFEVLSCIDCTEQQMAESIRLFEKRLLKEDFEATMFYYAGHGLRVKGVNYMVPVDVEGLTEANVEFECLEVQRVMNVLEKEEGSTNILVLDACLNNPFDQQAMWRDVGGALPEWAHTLPPSGTFAAYATEPGKRSSDGSGDNGLYTSKLIKYLKVPNLTLEQVFKYTRKEVMDASDNKQHPWESNRTVGDFYFKKKQDQQEVDSDGDGIPDLYDKCPNESGHLDYSGCPDRDQDGVPDPDDDCPDQRGLKSHHGCLPTSAPTDIDKDGDGIPNKYDKCPDEAGVIEEDGCPPPAVEKEEPVASEKPSPSRDLPRQFIEQIGGVSFTMKYVEGRSFEMGCTADQGNTYCYGSPEPAHDVTVGNYYIAETEITQELYEAVMGSNPSKFRGCAQCPVERVSWNDAKSFIKKLNQKSRWKYRLPTEAEWEFAARGGVEAQPSRFAGSDQIKDVAWYGGKKADEKTHAVKTKKPNELGLYDMTGNVSEWCEDDWHDNYVGAPEDGSAWIDGIRGSHRSVRGGSWMSGRSTSFIADRGRLKPEAKWGSTGFRIVASIP